MKIRFFVGLFSLFLILFCNVIAYADFSDFSVTWDEDNVITISGTTDLKDGKTICIKVVGPDIDIDNWLSMSNEEKLNHVTHIENVKTNGGKYTCSFKSLDEGAYYFFVSNKKEGEAFQRHYVLYKHTEDYIFENISNSKENCGELTEQAFISSVVENEKFFELSKTKYSLLSTDGKNAVANEIIKNKPYTDIVKIKEILYLNYYIQEIYESEQSDLIENLIKYAESLGIDELESYKWLKNAKGNTDIERVFRTKLTGSGRPDNLNSLIKKINEHQLLTEIYFTPHGGSVKDLLKIKHSQLNIDLKDYLGLPDSSYVDDRIAGKIFDDAAALKEKIDELIREMNEIKDKNKKENGRSSSSRGSVDIKVDNSIIPETKSVQSQTDDIKYIDISADHWAYESILRLSQRGAISGYDNKFRPDDKVTREEFIKIIMEAFQLVKEDAQCSFSDADKSKWYYKYIASAYELNIVKGIDENNFGIGNNISRQDAVTIAYNLINCKNLVLAKNKTEDFKDSEEISDYAKTAVNSFAGAKIINGDENGNFVPKGFLTRAEAAKIIFNLLVATS